MLRSFAFAPAFVALLLLASGARAAPDADVIAKSTGLIPEVQADVVRISVPRADLGVRVDGIAMSPFQGFTSWAAFQSAGDQTMVMGDIVVTENEANPALTAAIDAGLEVTALHNHFFHDEPRVFFMHVAGTGSTETLARGVKTTLDAVRAASSRDASEPARPPLVSPSQLEAGPLEAVLGTAGQAKDGMVKFVVGRTATMHGTRVGAAMGVNTWAVFAGRADDAIVDGDFAMLESELQGVLKALRRASIDVVAIHNHMTHEQPRYVFLHYWGRGPADELARGIKSALDTQAP
jgi:hypothetical protein